MNIEERFDKDGECRCLCIDKICGFFGLELEPVEAVRKIDSFIKTFNYLRYKGLEVDGYIDKRLLINPKYASYLLLYRNITCSKSFFERGVKNGIYLYYTSANELYGINEKWTHCVCELYDNGVRSIYDSYWEQIKQEYADVRFPDYDMLKRKLVIVIKIRRDTL